MTEEKYIEAMEIFTIERVHERLKEDQKSLEKLNNYKQKPDEVIQNGSGTTIIKQPTFEDLELNRNVLRQNIKFWREIISFHQSIGA